MTKYHELEVSATPSKKRVGRGISAGQGKTAGRGTKGQNARTGKKLRASFAGGSRTMVTAVPKVKGFKSFHTPALVVYSDELNAFAGKVVDNASLYEAGIISTPYQTVKAIMRKPITAKITLNVQAASKSVVANIEKLGGTFTVAASPYPKSTKTK